MAKILDMAECIIPPPLSTVVFGDHSSQSPLDQYQQPLTDPECGPEIPTNPTSHLNPSTILLPNCLLFNISTQI